MAFRGWVLVVFGVEDSVDIGDEEVDPDPDPDPDPEVLAVLEVDADPAGASPICSPPAPVVFLEITAIFQMNVEGVR